MTWIVVNIGCIECGVSSNIVGVFTDEDRARDIAAGLDQSHGWREDGQNAFEVFPMPPLDTVAAEYSPASGTSGSAQDPQGLDPKGAGPTAEGGDAQGIGHD